MKAKGFIEIEEWGQTDDKKPFNQPDKKSKGDHCGENIREKGDLPCGLFGKKSPERVIKKKKTNLKGGNSPKRRDWEEK